MLQFAFKHTLPKMNCMSECPGRAYVKSQVETSLHRYATFRRLFSQVKLSDFVNFALCCSCFIVALTLLFCINFFPEISLLWFLIMLIG